MLDADQKVCAGNGRAMFLLVVSYNLVAGMQITMSRMMEVRHTYVIGLHADSRFEDVDKIYDFIDDSGSHSGAQREVVERATGVLVECYEMRGTAQRPVIVKADFR